MKIKLFPGTFTEDLDSYIERFGLLGSEDLRPVFLIFILTAAAAGGGLGVGEKAVVTGGGGRKVTADGLKEDVPGGGGLQMT